MENRPPIKINKPIDPIRFIEIKKHPSMALVFLRAICISFFRPNMIDAAPAKKTGIILKNFSPDKNKINQYKAICSFSAARPDIIPISYLQTLFIGLLGKFITSSFFPVTPLGLIHVFQSMEQKRPVKTDEIIDLVCTLTAMKKTEKGVESTFTLDVLSGHTIIWQGVSIFFTKSRSKKRTPREKKEDRVLEKKETFIIPSHTGRNYARVSGDYNPHHLYTILAKLFGFKKAIAHGMWSFARVIASLDKEFAITGKALAEAHFKLPIFMPATTTIGFESHIDADTHQTIVDFELRDAEKGLPHLKGRLFNTL